MSFVWTKSTHKNILFVYMIQLLLRGTVFDIELVKE